MNVKQLIEQLQKLDPEAEIIGRMTACGEVTTTIDQSWVAELDATVTDPSQIIIVVKGECDEE